MEEEGNVSKKKKKRYVVKKIKCIGTLKDKSQTSAKTREIILSEGWKASQPIWAPWTLQQTGSLGVD